MRKILYLLPVAAFFVSCVADSIQEELSTSQGQHGVCLFDASISEREGTRVVGEWGTDGILAEWESSDRIGVFAGDETQAAVFTVKELDGTNAVFEGETIADAASYLAFYPYSELLGREGTSLSGKMNFLQRYSSPGYGENRIGIQPDFFPMLAYSPTGAHSLSFRQMCAYIRVRVRASATLAGDTYLKSVILQGNDGEVLAGEGIRVAVAAADDASLNIRTGDPVLSVDASEQTYSAVALDLTDPDQPEGETNGSLLSQSEFTEFYIALPPQNFAKGCKLTFIDTRNRYMGTLTSKPFNAARGQFVTFRAGGAEKVFEYIADNALIWQDTPRLLLHANRQAESPSGYDLTGGSDANLANCYVITPSMLAAHPDGLFCFPAKSPVQSGTVYWDDLLLDTNDYMVFTVDKTMARTGGNAVIGYLDPATGLVKWSWHIWVVTDELFAKDQDYERQEGEQTLIYRMMDRNLGANDPTGPVRVSTSGGARTPSRMLRPCTAPRAIRWTCTRGPVARGIPSIRYGMPRSAASRGIISTTAPWSSRSRIRRPTSPMPMRRIYRTPIRHGCAAMFRGIGTTVSGAPISRRRPWAPRPFCSRKAPSIPVRQGTASP